MENTRKKLLFVDDEPNILEMLKRMLARCEESWVGTFCQSVDEALEALGQCAYDTVVCDIRMPKKDGFALIQAMRERSDLAGIPIIVLTGEGDQTLKRRVLEMGATDLLNKPIGRDDLVARLRSTLRLKEYEDQLRDQVALLDGLVRQRTSQLERSHRQVIWRLAKAGEFRDDQTGRHVGRVAWCARILAEGLGLAQDLVSLIYETSPLHDIGKIGIPDAILLKPAKLTQDERKRMELHTIIGEGILRDPPRSVPVVSSSGGEPSLAVEGEQESPLVQVASTIARHHHEKWDGSGYPDALAGATIPIAARIVAVADVYDALLSRRPYKAAMAPEEALAVMDAGAENHFDPGCVRVLMSSLARIGQVYEQYDDVAGVSGNGGVLHAQHPVCG